MLGAEQQAFLGAVDGVMLSLGFARPHQSQEWSRRVGQDQLWIHLNFGLGVINASLGVEYLDLRRRWCDLPGAVCGPFVALSHQFEPARQYSTDDPPSIIVADLRDAGLAVLERLRDREAVAASLLMQSVHRWPTASFSHRIRLLPLLLIDLGRVAEARAFAASVAADAAARDQLRPPFPEFLSSLESRLDR
jgi:hypothetical protein